MRKRILIVGCLALFLATTVQARRGGSELTAPVCRFMQFYAAAERSELTAIERVVYSLAVAIRQPAVSERCS